MSNTAHASALSSMSPDDVKELRAWVCHRAVSLIQGADAALTQFAEDCPTPDEVRRVAVDVLKEVLKRFANGAPVTPTMSPDEARECVMAYLIEATAVPMLPAICHLLMMAGFDTSVISYHDIPGGARVGLAEGVPLLKFAGFLHEGAPTVAQAAMLMSIEEDATKH